jgi:transcriptional regulator with XRE-family HTH domain
MPRGKTAATLTFIDACSRILEEIQPASIRAVAYQLFIRHLLDSMEKSNTNKVSKQLVYAREQGIVPWDWIVDEAREEERITGKPDREVAEAVGVSRQTIAQWRQHPVFMAQLNQRRHTLWADAHARLRALIGGAVDVLEDAVRDGDLKAAIEVLKAVKPGGPLGLWLLLCGVYSRDHGPLAR